METFFALLALCEEKPPVTGGFPSQRPVTRSFFLICAWTSSWANNRDASYWRCHRARYDITVMSNLVSWGFQSRILAIAIPTFLTSYPHFSWHTSGSTVASHTITGSQAVTLDGTIRTPTIARTVCPMNRDIEWMASKGQIRQWIMQIRKSVKHRFIDSLFQLIFLNLFVLPSSIILQEVINSIGMQQ